MTGPAWLILPTYDEAENIEPLVRAALPVLEDAAPDGHPAWLALFRSTVDDADRYCVWVSQVATQPGADSRPCSVRFDSEADVQPA